MLADSYTVESLMDDGEVESGFRDDLKSVYWHRKLCIGSVIEKFLKKTLFLKTSEETHANPSTTGGPQGCGAPPLPGHPPPQVRRSGLRRRADQTDLRSAPEIFFFHLVTSFQFTCCIPYNDLKK